MTDYSESRTSRSLLERLRCGHDQRDWEEFYRKYYARVHRWCRARGLPDADADEATQRVFVRLLEALKKFHYDPDKGRFRGFLHKTTNFAVLDVLRELGRSDGRGIGGMDGDGRLGEIPDDSNLIAELEQAMLMEEVDARLRGAVNPWHFEAFRMVKEEGRSVEEIADRLHKTPNAVRVALHRVLRERKRILDELDGHE